jgi:hypothetical protein
VRRYTKLLGEYLSVARRLVEYDYKIRVLGVMLSRGFV